MIAGLHNQSPLLTMVRLRLNDPPYKSVLYIKHFIQGVAIREIEISVYGVLHSSMGRQCACLSWHVYSANVVGAIYVPTK